MNIKKSKKQIGVGGLILSNHEKKIVNEVSDIMKEEIIL